MKFETLKRRVDFSKIIKEGIYRKYKYFTIYILNRTDDSYILRIGFIISRKIGGAVLRNKIKRVIKEFLRKSNVNNLSKLDVLFIIKKDIDSFNFRELKKELEGSLDLFLTGH